MSFTSHIDQEVNAAKQFLEQWPKNWKAAKDNFMQKSEYRICQNCGHDTSHFECEYCCEDCYPIVSELQKDIPDDDEGDMEQRQRNRLMRVHRNLGHPSNRLLVQILTEAKAPKSIIDLARDLECPICDRMKRLAPARPANPVRAREVGEVMALDFFISLYRGWHQANGS